MILVVTVCFLANIWLWSSSTILMWMFWPSLPCCSLVHIELHFFQMKSNGKLCSWTATNTSQTLIGAEISNQDSESQHRPIPQHMVRWWALTESFWDYQVLVQCLAHPLCHIKRQVGSTLWVLSSACLSVPCCSPHKLWVSLSPQECSALFCLFVLFSWQISISVWLRVFLSHTDFWPKSKTECLSVHVVWGR